MAWRRPGDKPLSEPIIVSLLTHICVSRPQWVNAMKKKKYVCDSRCLLFEITGSTSSLTKPIRQAYSSINWTAWCINTLRLRQNGSHIAENIFKFIFQNENFCILIKISTKSVPRVPIYNKPALVWIMVWCRCQGMVCIKDWLPYGCIYVSLGFNELML